jgi:hypothetical protein
MAYIPSHAGEQQQPGFDSPGGFSPVQTQGSQHPPYVFESQGQVQPGVESHGGYPNDPPAASASRAGAIQWGSHTNANTSSIGMGYAEMPPQPQNQQQHRGHEPSPPPPPMQQQGSLAWETSQQPSYSQSHHGAGLGHPQQQQHEQQPPLGPLRGVQLQQNQTTKLNPTSLDVILRRFFSFSFLLFFLLTFNSQ